MADHKHGLTSDYIDILGVETHIVKYGNIKAANSTQEKRCLFLIIPGNPGIPEYYQQFMHTLWERSGERFPVWCVGHAGHVTGPGHPPLGWTDIVRHPGDRYSLEGQICHKINFIKDNIPPDVKLVLIGHSIGCYMILNILPHISQYHILRCFMLFPTIEQMANTPNGRIFTPALNYFRWLLVGMVKMMSYLGPKLHRRLVGTHFSDAAVPECAVQASLNLFNPTCVNLCTFMAKIEMADVGELQEGLLKRYMDCLSFYYGAADKWCPKEYCYNMKARFPRADIRLCDSDFSHAFVLDAGREMAHVVWDWLQGHL